MIGDNRKDKNPLLKPRYKGESNPKNWGAKYLNKEKVENFLVKLLKRYCEKSK